MALVAAVPAFLVSGGLLFVVYRYLQPKPPNPKRAALPCRCSCAHRTGLYRSAHFLHSYTLSVERCTVFGRAGWQ